ncbi:hypothetical protein [Alteromonas sp. BZK5]|uniref:hypothetical protein n=1 Tax=Alteromonas sp. BZK5 TaxID=1904459 RepID=UPI001653BC45|nr:hypothetical protein [Alteromonas sp. BZK5]MBC6987912.1 hypothetical protein [Alteromonas sp. BZK5]
MKDTKHGQEQIWSQLDQMLPNDENQHRDAIQENEVPTGCPDNSVQKRTGDVISSDKADEFSSQYQPIHEKSAESKTDMLNKSSKSTPLAETKDCAGEDSCSEGLNEKQALEPQPDKTKSVTKELIPETESYAKPIKYRPSIKAFVPHLSVLLLSLVVVFFPSIAISLFSQNDLEQLPSVMQDNLASIVQGAMLFISALIIFVVFKQKTSGLISVYGDYLEHKKSLIGKTTVHFADIRTIEVRKCLATSYSSIGDLHIITAKHHIVLPNLYEPFHLKSAILKRKEELNL